MARQQRHGRIIANREHLQTLENCSTLKTPESAPEPPRSPLRLIVSIRSYCGGLTWAFGCCSQIYEHVTQEANSTAHFSEAVRGQNRKHGKAASKLRKSCDSRSMFKNTFSLQICALHMRTESSAIRTQIPRISRIPNLCTPLDHGSQSNCRWEGRRLKTGTPDLGLGGVGSGLGGASISESIAGGIWNSFKSGLCISEL